MLKRRLSLEQTWQKCMKMWKEMIEKQWERGMDGINLKRAYFKNHPRMARPETLCYFCDYNKRREEYNCCSCPGRLVDRKFNCEKDSYHYDYKPKAFYRKLLALNKKRTK